MLLCLALVSAGCTPRLVRLTGSEHSGPLPGKAILGHKIIRFKWEYSDYGTATKGDGTARIAGPDSARLDFFLSTGMGNGHAILVGHGPIRSPDADELADMLPGPEFVWAALGRLHLPGVRDTLSMMRDGLLSADIGSNPLWRAVFDGDRLTELSRSVNRRVEERVTRAADGTVTYIRGKTLLRLSNLNEENAAPFPPDIWRN